MPVWIAGRKANLVLISYNSSTLGDITFVDLRKKRFRCAPISGFLAEARLFRHFRKESMKRLFGNIGPGLAAVLETNGRRHRYNAGEEIFSEGAPAEFLPIVISGAVKMIRSPEVGRDIIIGIFRDGEMFAVPPVFDGEPYPSSAFAIEKTVLLKIARADFLRILRESPDFSFAVINWMCGMLREKTSIIRNLAITSSERRVATVLLKLAAAEASNYPMKIPVRRQDIAEMASVSTETAIRVIRRLADRELVRIERGKIIVDDVDSLHEFLRA
jgi:CRP/FNR family transcriptional regulator, cyclic AMP receptor protein